MRTLASLPLLSCFLGLSIAASGACGGDTGNVVETDSGAQDSSTDAEQATDVSADTSTTDAATDTTSREAGECANPVRIVAGNLSSGNRQSYDPGHGKRILKGLSPTIALIQEFNYLSNSPTDLEAFVSDILGPGCKYVRGSGAIPNGVLTCLPILESGSWVDSEVSNRDFVWARIDLPGPKDLLVISIHLLTGQGRDVQGAQLAAKITSEAKGSYVVVGGDFNSSSRNDASIVPLKPVLDTTGPYPRGPAPSSGMEENTNATRKEALDWVLTDSDLRKRETPVLLGSRSFANGLVFDSRYYSPLADVPGVMASDSDAPSMQHMAVVRDFNVCP